MFNSGKKFRASRDKTNKCSNSRVAQKKKFLNEKKHSPPPLCKLNGRSRINSSVDASNPIEVDIKDTTATTRSASYLDLHLKIDSGARLRTPQDATQLQDVISALYQ